MFCSCHYTNMRLKNQCFSGLLKTMRAFSCKWIKFCIKFHKFSKRILLKKKRKKKKTLLNSLWKPWVFMGKYLQASEASHTWVQGVNPILSDRTFQIGWKASVSCHLLVFKRLKSWLWLKHARAVRIVPRLLQHCLSCMLWVIVKLKGEPSLQPQVPTVNTGVGLIQRTSLYLAPFVFLISQACFYSQSTKHCHFIIAAGIWETQCPGVTRSWPLGIKFKHAGPP